MIRNIISASAVCSVMAFPAPAVAGESRGEVRGGYAWDGNINSASVGAAVGHDWKFGAGQFIGVEGSVDKMTIDGGEYIWGASGRIGTRVGMRGKAYAIAGFSHAVGSSSHLGAGYQRSLGGPIYLKAEYRHMFNGSVNMVVGGIGFKF